MSFLFNHNNAICNLVLCIQAALSLTPMSSFLPIVVYFVQNSHEDAEGQVHYCELL